MKQRYSLRRACGRTLLTVLLGASLPAAAQSALAFNGTSSYAQTTLTSLTGTTVSMECWVKVTAFKTGTAITSGVIGMESGYDAAMLRFGDSGISANQLQFVLGIAGDHQKLTSTTVFNPNTWYHVAGTFDGTTMRLYINGVLNASLPMPGTVTGTGPFTIGRDYDNTRILNGSVDEVRVWTRTLTAAEIATNACAVSPTATGLAGYWKLDNGSGTTATDASSGNHPATLVGSPTWTTAFPVACGGPLAVRAGSTAGGLQVQVLDNPTQGTAANLEISGAQGLATKVQLLNLLGAVVLEQELTPTTAAARSSLPLPMAAGLYVVRVSTRAGTATTKLLKQ
jgi:hypothetical protein